MTAGAEGFYSALRTAAEQADPPPRRGLSRRLRARTTDRDREIPRADTAARADAMHAVEAAAREGRSADVIDLGAQHLHTDPAAHDVLELYLEACRIRNEPLATPVRVLAAAAAAGTHDGPDQRGLLDWVLFLGRPEQVEQPTASSDLVVRLVASLQGLSSDDHTRAVAAVEESESPGNATRAMLIDAAWRRDADALRRQSAQAEPAWVPTVSLRRALRIAVAERDMEWATALLEAYRDGAPGDAWAGSIEARLRELQSDDEYVARHGFPYSAPAPRSASNAAPGTVLYAVHSSYPFHTSGYSVRTQALTKAMRSQGVDVIPVTRFGYPTDLGITDPDPQGAIDGITYRRLLPDGEPMRTSPLVPYMTAYADRLEALARETGADLIHAASNYLDGFAANEAARRLGIPSVYEVRGLWEVTRASRDPEWGESAEFRRLAALEAHAACGADRVVTITGALADELVRRGVPRELITVVPNGVDLEAFNPADADPGPRPPGAPVTFGYIGTLVDYEGLDLLIRAVHSLRRKRPRIRARIVGDGPESEPLRQLARDLKVTDRVDFVGRVPHDQVLDEYRKIDVMVFPRLPLPVCEMVAPLKPYEAMALGKPVIASDVAALKEIVQGTAPQLLFAAGNVRSLINVVQHASTNPKQQHETAEAQHTRGTIIPSWESRAKRLRSIYTDAMNSHTS